MVTTESRPCPGCAGRSGRTLGRANAFEIRSCGGCGTLFTAALPAADEDKDYDSFYAEGRDLPVPEFVLGRLEQTVASLERYRRLNRWLDVGCGAGTLLRAAGNQGWEAVGTEVAGAAAAAGRAAGLDVRCGETPDLALPRGGFDVVSMVEVIEHVRDPDGLLAEAAGLVRPGGAVYLTTPHGRSLSARVLGTRWRVLSPPDHLQLFSVAGLRAALGRAGLSVSTVATHGVSPFELVAGLRDGRTQTQRRRSTAASYRLNESLSTRRAGVIVKRAVNAGLAAARLGDTVKLVAERRPA